MYNDLIILLYSVEWVLGLEKITPTNLGTGKNKKCEIKNRNREEGIETFLKVQIRIKYYYLNAYESN